MSRIGPIKSGVSVPRRQHGISLTKIEQFTATLHDTSLPPQTRLEALKFLVHFVGDVHQPLDASDNNDRGGNEVRLVFEGRRTNLHAIWDSGILAPAVNRQRAARARWCPIGRRIKSSV